MSEIKSRADLFEAAAKMMRMCDEAGVGYVFKFDGVVYNTIPQFVNSAHKYEFPLAIAEGKPVFKGDELYDERGIKYVAGFAREQESIWAKSYEPFLYGKSSNGHVYFCQMKNAKNFSWIPPKPRTVMVELLREDAEWYERNSWYVEVQIRISEACRKALEDK